MFRPYFVPSGVGNISGTTPIPLLYMAPTSTNDLWIARIFASTPAVSSPAPPGNGSVYFSLNVVTGTKAGGVAVTPTKTGPSALAANTVFSTGQATPITGLTQGAELWGRDVAFTGAGSWEDALENTGLERYIPASGQYAFYYVATSGAGTGMGARVDLDIVE